MNYKLCSTMDTMNGEKSGALDSATFSMAPASHTVFASRENCSKSVSLESRDGSTLEGKPDPMARTKGISATMALLNIIKGMIGPGCLSMPLALKQAGLWTGVILIVVCGFLNNLCMIKLVRSAQYLSRRKGHVLDFGTVAYEAVNGSFKVLRRFRGVAQVAVNASIIALQLGISSVYCVFVSVHAKELLEHYTSFRASTNLYFLMALAPLILINCTRSMKLIALYSAIGNATMAASLVYIFYFLISSSHVIAELPAITDLDGISTAIGSMLYAFEGQAMVLPLENRMKEPLRMTGVFGILSNSAWIVTLMYGMSGFLGYITYGTDVEGSIILNLPEATQFTVIRIAMILVVYLSFSVQQFVIMETVLPAMRRNMEFRFPAIPYLPVELLFRAGSVCFCMLVAVLVPSLDHIIPLVGVTVGNMLVFVFPASIDAVTFLPPMIAELAHTRPEHRLKKKMEIVWFAVVNGAFVAIGMFSLVAGLKSTIQDLVN